MQRTRALRTAFDAIGPGPWTFMQLHDEARKYRPELGEVQLEETLDRLVREGEVLHEVGFYTYRARPSQGDRKFGRALRRIKQREATK